MGFMSNPMNAFSNPFWRWRFSRGPCARGRGGAGARARVFLAALLLAAAIAPQAASASRGTILVYGDSLSAAYGIGQKEGWVSLLDERLRKSGPDYTVANASVSGETSSGGAARIAAALGRHKPKVLVLELGANDGLRGLPVAQMKRNLGTIIGAARSAGSKVLLVGMKMPPNYGAAYNQAYESAFRELAQQNGIPLIAFFLEPIMGGQAMFQPDQLHPTAQAQPLLLDAVWKALRPML
jgi:acyl-CoA thioesterase-1